MGVQKGERGKGCAVMAIQVLKFLALGLPFTSTPQVLPGPHPKACRGKASTPFAY